MSLENNYTSTPKEYILSQNYPNPFNPATTINYELKKSGIAEIKIFDIMGKEIQVLTNEMKSTGKYNVIFNATNLSNGIYFYSMEIDGIKIVVK